MSNRKMKLGHRFLHGLGLLCVGPLASWLTFGLVVDFQESPSSLSSLVMTWAYYLGITAIPMAFGLIFLSFVRPLCAWLIYAAGSAFMLYGQAMLTQASL